VSHILELVAIVSDTCLGPRSCHIPDTNPRLLHTTLPVILRCHSSSRVQTDQAHWLSFSIVFVRCLARSCTKRLTEILGMWRKFVILLSTSR